MSGSLPKVNIRDTKLLEGNWNLVLEMASRNFCCQMNSCNGLKDLQICYSVMEIVPPPLMNPAYLT
jgi:hypothetical protein